MKNALYFILGVAISVGGTLYAQGIIDNAIPPDSTSSVLTNKTDLDPEFSSYLDKIKYNDTFPVNRLIDKQYRIICYEGYNCVKL